MVFFSYMRIFRCPVRTITTVNLTILFKCCCLAPNNLAWKISLFCIFWQYHSQKYIFWSRSSSLRLILEYNFSNGRASIIFKFPLSFHLSRGWPNRIFWVLALSFQQLFFPCMIRQHSRSSRMFLKNVLKNPICFKFIFNSTDDESLKRIFLKLPNSIYLHFNHILALPIRINLVLSCFSHYFISVATWKRRNRKELCAYMKNYKR